MFNVQANRKVFKEFVDQRDIDQRYIDELECLLKSNGIQPPARTDPMAKAYQGDHTPIDIRMQDGSLASLEKSINHVKDHLMTRNFSVQFRDLTYWTLAPERRIPTVGSTLKTMFLGSGPKRRVDILKGLTGRLEPRTMTLLMGPPGCGKTTLMKALSGYSTGNRSTHLDGDILYNGDSTSTKKYLVQKLASYTDEEDIHAATLTVQETLEFAWLMTSGGHHSYGVAKDEASAALLDKQDEKKLKLNNIITMLGLREVANTVVGDAALKGISGGQKRRVTQGELLLPPRPVKFMDAISNGLDASTTYDIIRSHRFIVETLSLTGMTSLLQPAPEVFYTFHSLILMSEGQIVYHGPTTKALEYFQSLGYICPENTDAPDFLQELPTPDGRRFIPPGCKDVPRGADALAAAWKDSDLFKSMLSVMDQEVAESTGEWPSVFTEYYPGTFWFAFVQCLERQWKLTSRDTAFIKGRVMQSVVVAAIAGSLFSNLAPTDANSLNGVIFFSTLFNALSAMSMLPVIYSQKAVFFKHSKNLFFPTAAFVLSQTIVLYPFQIAETFTFSTIVYWSVGFSETTSGSRYFSFMLILFVFGLCASQLFRLLASAIPSREAAQPLAGICTVMMVLFSGFIVPESNIPNGWIWFYWINPAAYCLKAVSINEFLSPDYSFYLSGTNERFGDVQLSSRGTPTEMAWVWYCILIMLLMYIFFLLLSVYVLAYMQSEPAKEAPVHVDEIERLRDGEGEAEDSAMEVVSLVDIPFEPVTLSFIDVWYSVTPKGGEELDLLKGVSGYFEPGTVTALMGSSGAGKTTLLDVLAGRKNTGSITGNIFVNGRPKDQATFKRMMGYVEQFDSLSPHDTAREAVEFSAALRLPAGTPQDVRNLWVTSVLTLLELLPLENTLVGSQNSGGMSFEQKKRVSIALELAANPAVLFLDEPTSGLDSRSAQVVIRCIRRVAASGRSIVCTIHQPSSAIFEAFDRLLLLQRGGQTVFFGELGTNSAELVGYFEAVPGVAPKNPRQNPSVYALEAIGAGTQGAKASVDFHRYYLQSALCGANTVQVQALSHSGEGDEEDGHGMHLEVALTPHTTYNAPQSVQFKLLMRRFLLSYWRSPSYNVARMMVSLVIALIFSSTFVDQSYTSDVDVISRVALIYVTVLFMGVVGMISVQPIIFAERPAFYREQYSEIYDVKLYTLAATLVELPYLAVSSVLFVIPYFFIVGFDRDGTTVKFFWYWLFQALYMSVMVFLGHFLAAAMPHERASNVIGGMCSTMISLFAGFMIQVKNFPSFWVFMYWLDPLHYATEGLVVTQFHDDHSPVTLSGSGATTTASAFAAAMYPDWQYKHRGGDAVALVLFIIFLRTATYFSLAYLRHDKR